MNQELQAANHSDYVRGVDRNAGFDTQQSILQGTAMAGLTPEARTPARPICINPLSHGYYVIVGGQAFACESVDVLLHRLGTYLKAPAETEKRWMSGEWKL